MNEFTILDILVAICIKMLDMRAVIVVPLLSFRAFPMLQKNKSPGIIGVFVELITDVAFFLALRFNQCQQVLMKLIFDARF